MILIRGIKSEILNRPYGRRTRKLFEYSFPSPVSSIVLFHSLLPQGRFDEHYHTGSHELILFPKGGKITVNGVDHSLREWEGVLLEPGDSHGYNKEDQNDIVHLAIKMPADHDKVNI